MASVGAFNDMLSQFLSELIQTFPEEKSIKKYESAFDLLRKSNPRKVVENFMGTIAPLQERIMAKDETVLTSENLKSLNELNLAKNWDGASENTRSCIWQYLQALPFQPTRWLPSRVWLRRLQGRLLLVSSPRVIS